jgi:hypothetical protein
VLEFLTVDGSEERSTLRMLLPENIPLPSPPDGTRVFVEWVRALSTEEVEVGLYEVDVLARYMVAGDGQTYERAAPELFSIKVAVTELGPRVVTAPSVSVPAIPQGPPVSFGEVPAAIRDLVLAQHAGAEIVGGAQTSDGAWEVVALLAGTGGIVRPQMIVVGP